MMMMMMLAQSSFSLLCSSHSISSADVTSQCLPFLTQFRNQFACSKPSCSLIQSRVVGLQIYRRRRFSVVYCTGNSSPSAIEEIMETTLGDKDFVEIGYISDVHGLHGEIRVKHNTDFPDLRFGEPGKRWLRLRFSGQERVLEVELLAGRGQPGDKSWIVKFSGFDSIDQAKQLVGATFLVRKSDRPELEEGEFYSRDLVGMRVILKDTGEMVGTVVNVFNNGGNDLLHVMLDSSTKTYSEAVSQNSEISKSRQLVWIPFVEAIVPDVDMDRGEMHITPPKGLLELNLRSDERSKKERRLLEWKERKKFQRRLIAAKKKLCELEQQHILHGFRHGEKSQGNLLSQQIVSVNLHLLQQALQAVEMPNDGYNGRQSLHALITKKCGYALNISEKHIASLSREKMEAYCKHKEAGVNLISEGKVATVLMLSCEKPVASSDSDHEPCENHDNSMITHVENLFSNTRSFVTVEQRALVPVFLISPIHDIQALEKLFANHNYFGFNSEKVRFLENDYVPVVSSSAVEKKNKVLMKTPWMVHQSPLGSGGIISALASYNLLENLIESGIEYLELFKIKKRSLCWNPMFLGFVSSCETDIGILTFEDGKEFDDDEFHIVLSVKLIKKMVNQMGKLPLKPLLKSNSHVDFVDEKWIDVVPSAPNSYEFHCSIYDLLEACSPENACLMEVTQ